MDHEKKLSSIREEIENQEKVLVQLHKKRDRAIIKAHTEVSISAISRAVGISRTAIYTILDKKK